MDNNDTIAKSRHRRTIKAPVKMNISYRLHTDCLSLSATKSKVTDMCVFSEWILEQYNTDSLPTK